MILAFIEPEIIESVNFNICYNDFINVQFYLYYFRWLQNPHSMTANSKQQKFCYHRRCFELIYIHCWICSILRFSRNFVLLLQLCCNTYLHPILCSFYLIHCKSIAPLQTLYRRVVLFWIVNKLWSSGSVQCFFD